MRVLPIISAVLTTLLLFVPIMFLIAVIGLISDLPAIDIGHSTTTPPNNILASFFPAIEIAFVFVFWRHLKQAPLKKNIILSIVCGALFALLVVAGPGQFVLYSFLVPLYLIGLLH